MKINQYPLARIVAIILAGLCALYILNPLFWNATQALLTSAPLVLFLLTAIAITVIAIALVPQKQFHSFVDKFRSLHSGWLIFGWIVIWIGIIRLGENIANYYGLWVVLPLYTIFLLFFLIHLLNLSVPPIPAFTSSRQTAASVAVFFAFASILRDVVLIWMLYVNVNIDSLRYLGGLGYEEYSNEFRLLFTHAYFWFLDLFLASPTNPFPAVIAQIALSTLSIGLLIYVLSRWNLIIGFITGVFMVFNLSIGFSNRVLNTESLYTSLMILTVAVFFWQLRHKPRIGILIFAGFIIAVASYIRPAGMYFGYLIVVLYAMFIQPRIKTTIFISLGLLLAFVPIMIFNQVRYEQFVVTGSSGYYFSFPLVATGLFDEAAGPHSEQLAAFLSETCQMSIEGRPYSSTDQNIFFWNEFFFCIEEESSEIRRASSNLFTQAYIETILANPIQFGNYVFKNLDQQFSYPVQLNVVRDAYPITCASPLIPCSNGVDTVRIDSVESNTLHSFLEMTAYWHQPYFLFSNLHHIVFDTEWDLTYVPLTNLATTMGWLVMVMVIMRLADQTGRVLVIFSFLYIAYYYFVVVLASTPIDRYTEPTAPFHSLLSGILLGILLTHIPAIQATEYKKRRFQITMAVGTLVVTLAIPSVLFHMFVTHSEAYYTPVVRAEKELSESSYVVYHADPTLSPVRHAGIFFLYDNGELVTDEQQVYIENWKEQAYPGYLQLIGVDHLIISNRWLQSLSQSNQDLMNSSSQYNRAKTWYHPYAEDVYLYQVVGQSVAPIYYDNSTILFQLADNRIEIYGPVQDGNIALIISESLGKLTPGYEYTHEMDIEVSVTTQNPETIVVSYPDQINVEVPVPSPLISEPFSPTGS